MELASWDGAETLDNLSKVPKSNFTYFSMTDSLPVIMCIVLICSHPIPSARPSRFKQLREIICKGLFDPGLKRCSKIGGNIYESREAGRQHMNVG